MRVGARLGRNVEEQQRQRDTREDETFLPLANCGRQRVERLGRAVGLRRSAMVKKARCQKCGSKRLLLEDDAEATICTDCGTRQRHARHESQDAFQALNSRARITSTFSQPTASQQPLAERPPATTTLTLPQVLSAFQQLLQKLLLALEQLLPPLDAPRHDRLRAAVRYLWLGCAERVQWRLDSEAALPTQSPLLRLSGAKTIRLTPLVALSLLQLGAGMAGVLLLPEELAEWCMRGYVPVFAAHLGHGKRRDAVAMSLPSVVELAERLPTAERIVELALLVRDALGVAHPCATVDSVVSLAGGKLSLPTRVLELAVKLLGQAGSVDGGGDLGGKRKRGQRGGVNTVGATEQLRLDSAAALFVAAELTFDTTSSLEGDAEELLRRRMGVARDEAAADAAAAPNPWLQVEPALTRAALRTPGFASASAVDVLQMTREEQRRYLAFCARVCFLKPVSMGDAEVREEAHAFQLMAGEPSSTATAPPPPTQTRAVPLLGDLEFAPSASCTFFRPGSARSFLAPRGALLARALASAVHVGVHRLVERIDELKGRLLASDEPLPAPGASEARMDIVLIEQLARGSACDIVTGGNL